MTLSGMEREFGEVVRVESSRARWLAQQAVAALTDEARLTPKPALVDGRGNGAHRDLSLGLMELSARTLEPYFAEMAVAGRALAVGRELRERLGALGRRAERAMLAATGGVNTHRGAVWSLGLLIAADHGTGEVKDLVERAAAIAAIEDRFAGAAVSHGRAALLTYGAGGAREEAVAGFPHVASVGLPALRATRRRGGNEGHAQLDALMAIMASLEDTCLLHRGGLTALRAAQCGARAVLAGGGATTLEGMEAVHALDAALMRLWVSPGGSADLLAATLLVDRIRPEVFGA